MWGVDYKQSFMASCILNLLLALCLAFAFESADTVKKVKPMDAPVRIDMDLYKVQGTDKNKPIGRSAGGAAAGDPTKPYVGPTVNKASSDSPAPAAKNDYLGGTTPSESGGIAPSGVEGGTGTGEAGGGYGGTNTEGHGTGEGVGPSGEGTGGGNGYIDMDEYIGRLNSMKSYPPQAVQRGLEGTAVYSVTFSASGEVVSVSLIQSSGHGILDRAGESLIWSGGNITNTTGEGHTANIPLSYRLN